MLELKTKILFDPVDLTKKHKLQSSWKRTVVCTTSCDLHAYYAWFLKSRFNLKLNPPIRGTHITIVNDKIVDHKLYEECKKFFNGKEITFKYDPSEIRTNGEDWWIKVYSDDVENIRSCIGLPSKYFYNLHLTIGTANEKNLFHSQYILDTILRYNV